MPTIITGPVRLPDGTVPAHGRIIFRRREALVSVPVVLQGPVEGIIEDNGDFSVQLQGSTSGTRYAVTVEYFNAADQQLRAVDLPDAVVTGVENTLPLSQVISVPIPPGASNRLEIDQGETLNLGLQYLDHNQRPVSIADVDITSWIARGGGPRIPLVVAKVSAAAGTFEVSLSASQTAALAGAYSWALRMAVGARVKIKTGTIIVKEVA